MIFSLKKEKFLPKQHSHIVQGSLRKNWLRTSSEQGNLPAGPVRPGLSSEGFLASSLALQGQGSTEGSGIEMLGALEMNGNTWYIN